MSAVDPGTVGGGTLPAGITLPFGAYAFTVNGVTPGGSVDVTITYPATNPAPNGYAKVVGGVWTDASSLIVAQGGGSTTIRLTDGGLFDTNPAPGVIGDPGGPAVVVPPILGTFLSPVDAQPAVNTGRAGRAYPVKFRLASGGIPVTDLTAVTSIRYRSVPCSGTSPDDRGSARGGGARSQRAEGHRRNVPRQLGHAHHQGLLPAPDRSGRRWHPAGRLQPSLTATSVTEVTG